MGWTKEELKRADVISDYLKDFIAKVEARVPGTAYVPGTKRHVAVMYEDLVCDVHQTESPVTILYCPRYRAKGIPDYFISFWLKAAVAGNGYRGNVEVKIHNSMTHLAIDLAVDILNATTVDEVLTLTKAFESKVQ